MIELVQVIVIAIDRIETATKALMHEDIIFWNWDYGSRQPEPR
jgi:hypothetical protein